MTFLSKVGTFALNTSLGEQAIESVGFQPEIVLFLTSENVIDGVVASANVSFGAGVSSTNRISQSTSDEDNVVTTDGQRSLQAVNCIDLWVPGSGSSHQATADFVSLDIDGFTIDVTDVDGGLAYRVGYMALGGTDLTNVTTGTFTMTDTTGEESFTGVGFQPDSIIFLPFGNPIGSGGGQNLGLGFAVSATERGWISTSADNSLPTSLTGNWMDNDSAIGLIKDTDRSLDSKAEFVSFDADGFTVNWSNGAPVDDVYGYIAFQGVSATIGSFTAQTGGVGTKTVSGLAFTPQAALFLSTCGATVDAIADDIRYSIGIASDGDANFCCAGTSDNNVGTTVSDQRQNDAYCYLSQDPADASLIASASVSAWNSDGFDVYFDDPDDVASNILYLTFGAVASDIVSPFPTFRPQVS